MKHNHKEPDWNKLIANAHRQMNASKRAIEATIVGTPADWSRPIYNKPLVAPAPSPENTKIHIKKLNKKEHKKHNKIFVPQQKEKAKKSDKNGGLPIVRKTNQ